MARDDRFKRAQEAGADFLETARARAEEFLNGLSQAGEDTSGRAQGAFDEIIEGSRKGTEQLVNSIRKEISTQLGLLGLATKDDLADLERRLTAKKAAPRTAAAKRSTGKTTAGKTTATKASDTKATDTGKAPDPASTAKRPGPHTTAG